MAEPVFLYVEDDPKSCTVVKVLIQRVMGFQQLTIFEDSHDFLKRVHELDPQPTVFFLDIQIAPHDGYDMLQMLRQDATFSNATIIAMTANVMSHDVDKLKQVGFSGLIGKPLDHALFPQLVLRILAKDDIWYVP